MRPDLFEQHTVHFHGYPNASSFYDGVPDASVAINIGGSFTYYYLAPDAGTYFWHCHITPPEHLQMGMVGQLYVRPRQDRVPVGGSLYTSLQTRSDLPRHAAYRRHGLRTDATPATSCAATPCPRRTRVRPGHALASSAPRRGPTVRLQRRRRLHRLRRGIPDADPRLRSNFHFVGMTFNPEASPI